MNRLRAACFVLLLLTTFGVAASPTSAEEPGWSWITDVWGDPSVCNFATARRATPAQIIAAPKAYLGRCVRVRGIVGGGMVFQDQDAWYRFDESSALEGVKPGALGLYGFQRLKLGLTEPVEGDVTGQVSRCGDYGEFHGGYCNTFTPDRLFIASSGFLERPGRLTRLVGEAERKRIGNLTPMWVGNPAYAPAKARLEQAFEAVRQRDLKSFADQIGFVGEPFLEHPTLAFVLSDAKSPFADLRGRAHAPEITLFEVTPRPDAEAVHVLGCVCRYNDCGPVWPVHAVDADNDPTRPYACLGLEYSVLVPQPHWRQREPGWTVAAAKGHGPRQSRK